MQATILYSRPLSKHAGEAGCDRQDLDTQALSSLRGAELVGGQQARKIKGLSESQAHQLGPCLQRWRQREWEGGSLGPLSQPPLPRGSSSSLSKWSSSFCPAEMKPIEPGRTLLPLPHILPAKTPLQQVLLWSFRGTSKLDHFKCAPTQMLSWDESLGAGW